MKIIICLDDRQGMMFNHKRQSTDRYLRKNIIDSIEDNVLWMNQYSYEQFQNYKSENIKVDEDFLTKAGVDDYCFVEDKELKGIISQISCLIVYRWNKVYPHDRRLDIELAKGRWILLKREEFGGYSHEKITKEVYKRNDEEN